VSEDESQTPAEPDDPPALRDRLDPDLAAKIAGAPRVRQKPPEPAIDTRRYRWAIGIFGLVLVIAFSIEQFAANGVHTAGVAPGKQLQFFAAPIANSTLRGDANLNPPCSPARHDPRALNICLLAKRGPLALAFFSPASNDCKRQVDVLQSLAPRFSAVQFAAVAIRASQAQTATLVRSHHWTIPVAYDADGAVASQYDIAICPVVELASQGGIVKDRLIGNHWLAQGAVSSRLTGLVGG